MVGQHLIRCWSSTQKTIALSSAEAELTALVKTSCEAIGLSQLVLEWGIEVKAEVIVDASAALGVVNRRGSGKLRHVRIGQLWVQEKREREEIRFQKVGGTNNPADLMTKGLDQNTMVGHIDRLNVQRAGGRAEASLSI